MAMAQTPVAQKDQRARLMYLRMRVDEIKLEMAKNLEEFNAIKAALPKATGAEKRTMVMRATYLRQRNPALSEERAALVAEGKVIRPPVARQDGETNPTEHSSGSSAPIPVVPRGRRQSPRRP